MKIYQSSGGRDHDETDVARFSRHCPKDFTTLPARLQILEVGEASAKFMSEIEIAEENSIRSSGMVAACKEVVDLGADLMVL